MIIKFYQRNSLHQTQRRQDTPHRDYAGGRLSEATDSICSGRLPVNCYTVASFKTTWAGIAQRMPTVHSEPEEYGIRFHCSCLERFDLQKKLEKLEKFLRFLIITASSRRRRDGDGFHARWSRFMGIFITYRCIKETRAQLFRAMDSPDNSAETEDTSTDPPGERPKKRPRKLISSNEHSTSNVRKPPKMVRSDELLAFIGETIHGSLDEWGIMLTKARGKGNVQLKFIDHLKKHPNPLTNGKTSTAETVSKWINAGMELAGKETERRAGGAAAGGAIPNDEVSKPQRVWFELNQAYQDFLRDKLTTIRYTTPPEHLKGKVQLK
jgi:hypothetical protein